MNAPEFQYDIAFSFVAEDEGLASQLADHFEGRLRVFLYSRKQEQIAGTDGEEAFNAVFASQSRLVVVLHRDGWGETPWTRIEETAIRNRGYDEGYDFVIFIPLDNKPAVPRWLPKNRLWVGLQRWGLRCAASVIDARFQELGGTSRGESLVDLAVRAERLLKFEQSRRRFLKSATGVQRANEAYQALRKDILAAVPDLKAQAPSLNISVMDAGFELAIFSSAPALLVSWQPKFMHTLEDSQLEVSIWLGRPVFPNDRYEDPPSSVDEIIFQADLALSGDVVWSTSMSNDPLAMESAAAADYILSWWLSRALSHAD